MATIRCIYILLHFVRGAYVINCPFTCQHSMSNDIIWLAPTQLRPSAIFENFRIRIACVQAKTDKSLTWIMAKSMTMRR